LETQHNLPAFCNHLSAYFTLEQQALFRSIRRLLTSAGTLESVRNQTETQLPLSIKLIIQKQSCFGYKIYSPAMKMMSTLTQQVDLVGNTFALISISKNKQKSTLGGSFLLDGG